MTRYDLILLAWLAAAGSAQAITVTNGSFENGAAISGGSDLLVPGDSTSITGWTVVGAGGVDYVDNSLWDASDGVRSVELDGVSAGGVFQTITDQFTVGGRYVLRFDLSANPFAADGLYSALVSVTGSAAEEFSYLKTSANASDSMNYMTYAYNFTASSTSKRIEFLGTNTGFLGIVLDNVSISSVPEPQTWAMLIAGFGLIGASMRSVRKTRLLA